MNDMFAVRQRSGASSTKRNWLSWK